MFEEFKKSMMDGFEMTDLGLMHYFIGIKVVQTGDGILFSKKKKNARENLEKFQMQDCNPVSTVLECGLKLHKD